MRPTISAIALAALAAPALADLTVPLDLCGTYNAAGGFGNSPTHQNYRCGLSPITTTPETRNFFIFDLSPYAPVPAGTVTEAYVKLYLPMFAPGVFLDPGFGYISPDPSEHFVLTSTFPFTAADLADPTNAPPEATGIWAALGTGPLAGEITVTPGMMGFIMTIPLLPPAVGAINGLLGHDKLALGGRIESFAGTYVDELLFGFTDIPSLHMAGKEPELELHFAPAPGGLGLLGLGGIVAMRRRRIVG